VGAINKIDLPEISEDGFKVSNVKIDIMPIDTKNVKIGMQSSDNSIQFVAQNLAIQIKGDFKYKLFLITYHGRFEAVVEENGASLALGLPLLTQQSGSKLLPAININNMNLNIDSNKVKITLSGSIVADIADLFVGFFKKTILKAVVKEVDNGIPPLIVSEINTLISQTQGVIVISELGNIAFDFSLDSAPVVSDTQLDLYLNATIFNGSLAESYPSTPIPDLPLAP
jgi:hypothetical protein